MPVQCRSFFAWHWMFAKVQVSTSPSWGKCESDPLPARYVIAWLTHQPSNKCIGLNLGYYLILAWHILHCINWYSLFAFGLMWLWILDALVLVHRSSLNSHPWQTSILFLVCWLILHLPVCVYYIPQYCSRVIGVSVCMNYPPLISNIRDQCRHKFQILLPVRHFVNRDSKDLAVSHVYFFGV